MAKCLVLLLFVCHLLGGQDRQKEINDQVWKPFIKTFAENDTEGFMALHSKDLVRSARESNTVLNWEQYFSNSKKSQERDKSSNRKRNIDLRFTERIVSDNRAIEVGIYKTTYLLADGTSQSYYGKFLVVLRKENGIWRILVDTDSSEGGTIDEKSYLSAKAIDQ